MVKAGGVNMGKTVKIEIIEKFIKENKISKRAFCKLCKISPSTLNKRMSKRDNFRIIALFKIAKVIKIEVYQFFK